MGKIVRDAALEIIGHPNATREIVGHPVEAPVEIVGHPNAFLPVEAPVGKETDTLANEDHRRMHRPIVNALVTTTINDSLVQEILLPNQKDVLLPRNLLAHAVVGSTMRRMLKEREREMAAMTLCSTLFKLCSASLNSLKTKTTQPREIIANWV